MVIEQLQLRYQDLDPYGHVNNAVYLEFFEQIRLAYWRALAKNLGVETLVAGNIPGVRYVIAETTVRYKAPIELDDILHGAASVVSVTDRSYGMDFELRVGETFEEGEKVAGGYAGHVFYDAEAQKPRPKPDWFLEAVAELEGQPETSFLAPGKH